MKIILIFLRIFIVFYCYYLIRKEKKNVRNIVWFMYFLVLAVSLYSVGNIIINVVAEPYIWDFPAFYLYSKVGAEGYNFYQPENFQTVFNSIHAQYEHYSFLEGFIEEVVHTGFPYPPPTMLYLFWLGYFPLQQALVIWLVVVLVSMLACVYLMYNQFFKQDKLNGLIFVLLLFLMLSPVRSTIFYTQTNFLALLFLLLMKKYEQSKYAGVFLVLAVFIKPYMAIFGLVFILLKKWKAVLYALITGTILSLITIAAFGINTFTSYFQNDYVHRLPKIVFSADNNQSLQAVLLRSNWISLEQPMTYSLISLGILSVTFIYSIYLLRRKMTDYIWAIYLLVALLIYPGTLEYYGVLLLFIIAQFFYVNSQLKFNLSLGFLVTGITYLITTYSLFYAIIFLICILVIKSFGLLNNVATSVILTKIHSNTIFDLVLKRSGKAK